jgi:hypothetical protein
MSEFFFFFFFLKTLTMYYLTLFVAELLKKNWKKYIKNFDFVNFTSVVKKTKQKK